MLRAELVNRDMKSPLNQAVLDDDDGHDAVSTQSTAPIHRSMNSPNAFGAMKGDQTRTNTMKVEYMLCNADDWYLSRMSASGKVFWKLLLVTL